MSLVLAPCAQDLLFRAARTAHAYTDDPVPEEQVRAIHELIRYAPTSLNQQPMRVVLVRTHGARERLAGHMHGSNRDQVLGAPLSAILFADNEFHEELPRLFPARPGAKDAYFAERTVRERSAAFNTTLQMAYFIVGIRAAGLAAGPIVGFDFPGVDKEFGDPDHSVQAVVTLGTPDETAFRPRAPRLDYDEVFTTV